MKDIDYIKKWYTIDFDNGQAVSNISGRDDSGRFQKGEKEFMPYVKIVFAYQLQQLMTNHSMYMIKQTPADSRKLVSLESFDVIYGADIRCRRCVLTAPLFNISLTR